MAKLNDVRPEPVWPESAPPFEALVPLAGLIGFVERKNPESVGVRRVAGEIINQLGQHERFVLTEATMEELVRVTKPEIASAILNQRTGAVSQRDESGPIGLGQATLGFESDSDSD